MLERSCSNGVCVAQAAVWSNLQEYGYQQAKRDTSTYHNKKVNITAFTWTCSMT